MYSTYGTSMDLVRSNLRALERRLQQAKMVLVGMESEQEMADVLVEAIDEEQEVQEELEAQEVQDHHSHHLPPDPAALADQEHCHQLGERLLSHLGRPHRRGRGQIH